MPYQTEGLRDFCEQILSKVGLSESEAANNADSLIQADLRGIASHGVTRLRTYANRIKTGVVKAGQKPSILNDAPTTLLVDANNGTGSSVGIQVMDLCMERARTYGSCFAAVRQANHFGIASYFTQHAARNGMIGIAMSNCPASVVPTGGRKPMFGTNPLSVAIPAGSYEPFVLDMATSTVAQGKVILADKEGKSIPDSWAVDPQGNPTTVPSEALKGAMLPFGGPKGYAIGFIIEILCSALSGAFNSREINNFWKDFENPQNLGWFMGVFNIASFVPREQFHDRIDQLFADIKACPPTPGNQEVFIPGEIEQRGVERRLKEGIELGDAVVADLIDLGKEYAVSWPF
ncbi:MAG: Ldh family oxidoreductase [Bacillota bacterium]|nr:Ldh family oxidoreductase [Bacillota bacterium]